MLSFRGNMAKIYCTAVDKPSGNYFLLTFASFDTCAKTNANTAQSQLFTALRFAFCISKTDYL